MVQKINFLVNLLFVLALGITATSCHNNNVEPQPLEENKIRCSGEIISTVPAPYNRWFIGQDSAENEAAYTNNGLGSTVYVRPGVSEALYGKLDACHGVSKGRYLDYKMQFYNYKFQCKMIQFLDSSILRITYSPLKPNQPEEWNLYLELKERIGLPIEKGYTHYGTRVNYFRIDSLEAAGRMYYDVLKLTNDLPEARENPNDIHSFFVDTLAGVIAFELNNALTWEIRYD